MTPRLQKARARLRKCELAQQLFLPSLPLMTIKV